MKKVLRIILWFQLQWKFKWNHPKVRKELVRLGLTYFDTEQKNHKSYPVHKLGKWGEK